MKKENENKLYLKVPEFDELWYRKKLLADPYTMNFNKGYDFKLPNYNYENGTIDFDETMWADWFDKWVKDKNNFYAYVVRNLDNEYIGEVSFKKKDNEGCETNILLASSARGFNYSYEALNLLAKEAFEERGLDSLHDSLQEELYEKVKTFKEAGYKKIGSSNSDIKKYGMPQKLIDVEYTKNDYMKKAKRKVTDKLISFFTKFE